MQSKPASPAKRPSFVDAEGSRIVFRRKVNPAGHRDFMFVLGRCLRSRPDIVTLDFGQISHAYPNGMIPIICTADHLRRMGLAVSLVLPSHPVVRSMFISSNWAHLLSPTTFPPQNTAHERYLAARRFQTSEQQRQVVNDFLDVVMRNMSVSRDIVSGLEWSINEVTDNVLNHAQCPDGGVVQVTTYPDNNSVAFAVGDSGAGILSTLRQGIPTLETDEQAIGEAVKAGVTRSADVGQGNGLAGTLSIATSSGGGFTITSGQGHMSVIGGEVEQRQRMPYHSYAGTLVCADMRTDIDFSIGDALSFDCAPRHVPVDIIELNYESEDGQCFVLRLCDETTGFGTRSSGRQVRTKCLNLLGADIQKPINVDWTGIPLVSSSFADELMGKLFLELGPLTFGARVRNVGMQSLIRALIDKAITQRLQQVSDED